MIVNETIDNILDLGEQYVNYCQTNVLLTYPTVDADNEEKATIIIQPFSDGIVFSYALDDEPLGILLATGRVWSYKEYDIVRVGELFDDGTWKAIANALDEALQDAD